MERFLVAFEAPDDVSAEAYESKWDRWVRTLHSRRLQLVNDLDPIVVAGGDDSIRVYEAVGL